MKVLAVFNGISETNIPYENFKHVSEVGIDKRMCTFSGIVENQESERVSRSMEVQIPAVNRNYGSGGIIVLTKAILGLHPDVIHVHHALSGFIASLIGRWITKSKVVVTIHSNYRYFNKLQKVLICVNLHLADLIVCNSESTKQSIKNVTSIKRYKERVCVIYNGVDSAKIKTRPANPLGYGKDARARFVIVGRLVKAKGHDLLLKAISELKNCGKFVSLDVVGDGPLEKELKELVRNYGIESQVSFLGAMKREDVYASLAEIDCIVISSRWEGFCNAMVEAMFSEVPIIAADLDVLKEVLGEGNGVYFASGNAKSLAEKINYVLDNYEAALEMTRRAKDRAVKRYDIKESAANYERLYKALFSGGHINC